jgi:hypothetical protein
MQPVSGYRISTSGMRCHLVPLLSYLNWEAMWVPKQIKEDSSLLTMAETILGTNQTLIKSGKNVYFLIQGIPDIELTRAFARSRRALELAGKVKEQPIEPTFPPFIFL